MEITLWERQVKVKDEFVWEFNHISDGFDSQATKPIPNHPDQKSWLKSNWRATKASLIDGKVVK
jgi:hypothetical protein